MVERAVLPIFDRKEGKDSEDDQRIRNMFKGFKGFGRCSKVSEDVLPWNCGRTCGSTNFWGRNGF